MLVGTTARRELLEHDGRWLLKFHFRILSTVLSLFAILCLAIAATAYGSNSTAAWNAESEDIVLPDIYTLAVLSWSVIWNLVNYLVLSVKHRPVNAGATVAVELLTWLCLAASAGYLIGNVTSFYNTWAAEGDVGPKEWEYAGIALTLMAVIVHFILFLYACRYCHHARKQKKKTEKGELGHVAKLDLESVSELEHVVKVDLEIVSKLQDTAKPPPASPILIACLHCQRDVCDHGHEDDQLVPGAPNGSPPRYSATVKEVLGA